MNKHYYYLFTVFIFIGCTKEIALPESVSEFSITYFDYYTESAQIYLYTEIEKSLTIQSIDSVWADVINQDSEKILTAKLLQTNNLNDSLWNVNSFSYKEFISPFESGNYWVKFYISVSGKLDSLTTNSKYLSIFDGNAIPEIISWEVPNEFQIDEADWKDLPILLTIFDLNGNDNIQNVKYEVKRFFDGCEVECIIDPNCNDIIEDSEFQSDETLDLEFIQYNSAGFLYRVVIKMRPLDGSSYEDEHNQFEARDCGRTGLIIIRFIITDLDANQIFSNEIPIEIVAP